MPQLDDCVLIHFVEEQTIGFRFPRHRNDWPLHITLASWFTPGNLPLLLEKLESIAESAEPFKLQVGKLEMFGPKQNVPVNVIVNPERAKDLHDRLVAAVRDTEGMFDSSRWFENYRAHITQHDGDASQEGDEMTVGDFHMVRLLPDNICEVVQQFRLRGRA